MEEIQFAEDSLSGAPAQPVRRGFTGWLIDHGVVANEYRAVLVLLGVIVVALGVSAWLTFGGGSHRPSLEQMRQMPGYTPPSP
ncbi:MAG: hypothetical protein KGI78_02920 [Patescibacteria group bacterium]|nr:hypothetical protein [Patescibacteria group bacterium]MDE1944544.1 hypothetical protein [Patescibacteria group bacterium]MDE1945469.1 hypothetical protein [Patescibacteria group bacterium]MDE2057782.1 hypothetical protein [Patescibacteria group bacterium]